MDEMVLVGRLREETPRPDRARLAPGRELLRQAARCEGTGAAKPLKGLSDLLRRRLAVAVVAAAVVGTGVAVVPHSPSRGGTALPAVQPPSADLSRTMLQAASAVEHRSVPRPGDGQWVYTKATAAAGFFLGDGSGQKPVVRPQVSEEWVRFDGLQLGLTDPAGQLMVVTNSPEGDDRTPKQAWDYLQSLPIDPVALRARIDRSAQERAARSHMPAASTDEQAFGEIGILLGEAPVVPNALQGALYRVLAQIPGTGIDRDAKDAAGRSGLALTHTTAHGDEEVRIFLDPATYQYRGRSTVSLRDHALPVPVGAPQEQEHLTYAPGVDTAPPLIKKGQDMGSTARIVTAVVDRPGQTP